MKSKLLIIFLSLFYLPTISQSIKQDDCQLSFSEIGIIDFNLGSNYKSFTNDSKKRKFKKESVYGIDIVIFSENIILLKEKKTVEYNLKFKDNILMDYSFRIKAGNFREAPYYYEKVLKLLKKNKNKNSFMTKGGYSFMKTTKECKKFFNLDPEGDDYYISGGIGYESPIWEKQFRDYMKATGQDNK
ncbi:hypothetical protein NTJ12_002419 [Flavobacterium psychrophilum]|nr:hypothetical protein [Flavobacterium psychrophilum]